MMPGAALVSNASSHLVSPIPPGSALRASELGICFRSVFQISRVTLGPLSFSFPEPGGTGAGSMLEAFSGASVETVRESLTLLSDAERADRLAVHRFSDQLQVLACRSFLSSLFLQPRVLIPDFCFPVSGLGARDARFFFPRSRWARGACF